MRISDWSSDVCYSDLQVRIAQQVEGLPLDRLADHVADHAADHRAGRTADHAANDLSCKFRDISKIKHRRSPFWIGDIAKLDRKSTRLNSVTNAHLVCRLLLEKKKNTQAHNYKIKQN